VPDSQVANVVCPINEPKRIGRPVNHAPLAGRIR
jgi:hypothetical protein